MKITKTMTETYTLRGDYGLWAKINLECGKKSVNVMISSDYGSFDYFWHDCGSNPKKFLTTLHWHYTMKKLMNGEHNLYEPDFDTRLINFKKTIIQFRKDKYITINQARDIWDIMIELFKDCNNDDFYYYKIINEDIFCNLFSDMESIPNDHKLKPVVMDFWNKIWLPFIEYLKTEIPENQEKVRIDKK